MSELRHDWDARKRSEDWFAAWQREQQRRSARTARVVIGLVAFGMAALVGVNIFFRE